MKHLNLLGGGFQHAYSSTWWKRPKKFVWDFESKRNPVSVYCDDGIARGLQDKHDSKKKYAWILESRSLSQPYVDQIKANLSEYLEVYELFFVHDKELLSLHDKFVWCPAYGTCIEDIRIHPKTKMCSMISSCKVSTPLQRLRCRMIKELSDDPLVQIYGREINPIDKKEVGLCDYRFSIAIENDSYETYYTEKLLDCFATGTIPLYIGPSDIGDHYDPGGIIPLTPDFDFSRLTVVLYQSKIKHVENNFERVLELDVLDDWIYGQYLT